MLIFSHLITRNFVLILTAVVFSLVGSIAVHATDSSAEWVNKKSQNGIEVLQREVSQSPYRETRGTMSTTAGMFAIIAVLKDSAACAEWLYMCRFAETIQTSDAGSSLNYMVIDSPLFLQDRDMYVRSLTRYFPASKRIIVQLTGAAEYAPLQSKRVRVLDLRGQWELQELSDDRTQVSYQIHSNPQVGVKGPANRTMVTSVFDTLQNLDRLAQTPPYQNATFSDQEKLDITVKPQGESVTTPTR